MNFLHFNTPQAKQTAIFILFIIIVGLGIIFYTLFSLNRENSQLQNKISIYNLSTSLLQRKLFLSQSENIAIKESLQTEQQNNAYFEDKINTISGTVGILEKLSKTDAELLKKYSKIYFLNENYVPTKLTQIPEGYLYTKDKPVEIHTDVYPYLIALINAALNDNVIIQVISAYRSFGTQAYLKSGYKITYGIGTANKFSADQGYSEHQLGTTVDFTNPKIGQSFVGFEKTDSYKWLLENAHEFGFVISYPKQNTYYSFEPWHWRYVGVKLATKLYNEKIYFYDLNQRVIDEFLVDLF